MQGLDRRRTPLFVAASVVLAAIIVLVIVLAALQVSHSSAPPSRSSAPPGGSEATPVIVRAVTTAVRAVPTTFQAATAANPGLLDSLVVCSSADFDTRANHCKKSDTQLSAGNGGLTIDGDLSFPDYMSGTISLLRKNGASWQRLGGFSTKTYPDVVVIDSNTFISVQLANVFAYGGHGATPGCSSNWGIEVDDSQGLPLGDARFTYSCK